MRLARRASLGDPDTDAVRPLDHDDRAHLAACAPCRAWIAQVDPPALFSLLALERKDEAFWTGFETRVLASIREQEREPAGWMALLRPRIAGLIAATGTLAVIAVLLTAQRTPGPVRDAPAHAVAARAPSQDVAGVPPLVAPDIAPAPLPPPRDAAAPSAVESVLSPTAQVFSIHLSERGADPSDDSPEVILIVDQRIDL